MNTTRDSSHKNGIRGRLVDAVREEENITLLESAPILFVHLGALGAFLVGFSQAALIACLVTYLFRVFALTAGYHRYFSHRSYRTSRVFQFILGFLGASAAQLGPLWWAAHHRHHHQYADTSRDIHSPSWKGFLWAHIGWLLCPKASHPQYERVKDLMRYPELRFIDRFHALAPLSLGLLLYGTGAGLERFYPALGTSGWQMVVWGFFVSTALVYHVTFCVNSVTHIFGKRRFSTEDESKNSWWVALLTMGEGWHNNHHRYPISARQGFYWWEVDFSYYLLCLLEKLGVVWNLKVPPPKLYTEAERLKRSRVTTKVSMAEKR